VAGQQPVGPRRVRAQRGLGRGGDDPQLVPRCQAGAAGRPVPVGQRDQAFGGEAFAPGADGVDVPPGCAGPRRRPASRRPPPGSRWRAGYAYIDAVLDDEDDVLQLCRLKDTGHPELWGFALFTYSNERYEDNILPTGLPFGTPEDALDCAAGLYLGDPTA